MNKLIKEFNYFDLVEVNEGVYAAIKSDDLCMSNAGFIDLGNKIVVFDTYLSIEAAKELKKVIKDFTGFEDVMVVNSHSHIDHFVGNCIFSEDTPIISSSEVYNQIVQYLDQIEFGEQANYKEVRKLEERLAKAEDRSEILDIENSLIIYRALSNEEGRVVPPNIIFDGRLTIHGSSDSFELVEINIAHSKGDVIGISKERKVAFVGDLLFVNEHPYLGQGDPEKLKDELKKLLKMDIEYFIPGHGPVCQKEKIEEQIEYIDAIMNLVKKNHDRPEKLKPEELPSKFKSYIGPCFSWNINFLIEYYKNK